MRSISLVLSLVVCGVAAVGFAQRGQGGQGGPGGPGGPGGGRGMGMGMGGGRPMSDTNAMLLGLPAVQSELHLSAGQIAKIQAAMPQRGGGRGPGSPGGTGGQQGDMRKAMEDRMKTMNATLASLTPAQRQRLHELTLQAYGPAALNMASVQKSLGLSKDQIAKLNAEQQKIMKERQAMFQNMGTNRPGQTGNQAEWQKRIDDMRAKNEKWRAEETSNADKVLNATQRAKWHSMLGKPFDLSKLRTQRRGR